MKNKLALSITAIFSSLLLSACGSTNSVPNSDSYQPKPRIITSNSIVGGLWLLSTINGSAYQGKRLFLNLNDKNKVNGFAGCNRFFTSIAELNSNQVRFSSIGSTRMGCPDNALLENDFLNALRGIRSFQLNSDQLILTGESFELVFFKKSARR